MGGRLSRNDPNDEPQLYAVATPHPTLQYIYPVYAAPADLDRIERKKKQKRSPPRSWSSGKTKKPKRAKLIQVINEPQMGAYLSPAQSDDGAWYCYHVDKSGVIDYVEPGTSVPSAPSSPQDFSPTLYVPLPTQLDRQPVPQHVYPTSPYSHSSYSYPINSPGYIAQPHPVPFGSIPPTNVYEQSTTFQDPYSARATNASPLRPHVISPAPSYRPASPSSPSSYGRTVTPTLGPRALASPSPGPYGAYRRTPYPPPHPPLAPSPSPGHRVVPDGDYQGEETAEEEAGFETDSGMSPVAHARLNSRPGRHHPALPSEPSSRASSPSTAPPRSARPTWSQSSGAAFGQRLRDAFRTN